jgi:hypothetical protein
MDWKTRRRQRTNYNCPDQRRKICSFNPNTKLGAQKVGNKLEKDWKKTNTASVLYWPKKEKILFPTQCWKLGAKLAENKICKTAAIYNFLSQVMSRVLDHDLQSYWQVVKSKRCVGDEGNATETDETRKQKRGSEGQRGRRGRARRGKEAEW